MTTRPWRALALALLVATGLAACSDAGAPSSDVSSRTLDCGDVIDIIEAPPDDWDIVLDAIALPLDQVHQRGRSDDDGRQFSKFGLVIRSDTPLTITVAEASRPNALVGWDSSGKLPTTQLDITGCSPDCVPGIDGCLGQRSGSWLVYAGGVWTLEPDCVELEVSSGDRAVVSSLPIGTECDT